MDAPLRELFERIAPHADPVRPELGAIGGALSALASDHEYLGRAIEREGEASGSFPLHVPARGPRLMLVHRLEGQMSAVHDHGVWVAVAAIVGIETHRRYRATGPDRSLVRVSEERGLGPSACATLMPPDDIHDHGHLVGRGSPAWVLILLGDDQFLTQRSEWDPGSGRRRVLEPGDRGRWLASEPFPA